MRTGASARGIGLRVQVPAGWLLSVDPGVHHCGWALWWHGVLVASGVAAVPSGSTATAMVFAVLAAARQMPNGEGRAGPFYVAVETPQDYPGRHAPVADLDRIRQVVDALAPGTQLYPREWKANVPKDVHGRRIRGLLSEDEAERVPWDQDDAVDAVGIGLFVLGRAGRGGTRP